MDDRDLMIILLVVVVAILLYMLYKRGGLGLFGNLESVMPPASKPIGGYLY